MAARVPSALSHQQCHRKRIPSCSKRHVQVSFDTKHVMLVMHVIHSNRYHTCYPTFAYTGFLRVINVNSEHPLPVLKEACNTLGPNNVKDYISSPCFRVWFDNTETPSKCIGPFDYTQNWVNRYASVHYKKPGESTVRDGYVPWIETNWFKQWKGIPDDYYLNEDKTPLCGKYVEVVVSVMQLNVEHSYTPTNNPLPCI